MVVLYALNVFSFDVSITSEMLPFSGRTFAGYCPRRLNVRERGAVVANNLSFWFVSVHFKNKQYILRKLRVYSNLRSEKKNIINKSVCKVYELLQRLYPFKCNYLNRNRWLFWFIN